MFLTVAYILVSPVCVRFCILFRFDVATAIVNIFSFGLSITLRTHVDFVYATFYDTHACLQSARNYLRMKRHVPLYSRWKCVFLWITNSTQYRFSGQWSPSLYVVACRGCFSIANHSTHENGHEKHKSDNGYRNTTKKPNSNKTNKLFLSKLNLVWVFVFRNNSSSTPLKSNEWQQ